MIEQGSSRRGHPTPYAAQCACWRALLLALVLCPGLSAAETSIRLRFEWGGGQVERQWNGRITLDAGELSELRTLGIEADEPGSIWIDGQRELVIRQRSGRRYDGFDVAITADETALLSIEIEPTDREPGGAVFEVPLSSLTQQYDRRKLDDRGNFILIHRSPGDLLPIELERDRLVFGPGEAIRFQLSHRLSDVSAGEQLQYQIELTPARGSQNLWSQEYTVNSRDAQGRALAIDVEVPAPVTEGAYDVNIRVIEWGLRQRFVGARPLATRKLQFVVVSPRSPPAPLLHPDRWHTEVEIDPAEQRWWERLPRWSPLERLPGFPQGPLGSGHLTRWSESAGALMQLTPAPDQEASWQAYPLPIAQPGMPHILEIEFSADVAQHLGISIVEPNSLGTVWPIGVDSGVYTSRAVASPPTGGVHRLHFWPKTKNPLLLLSNFSDDAPVAFGKIRVLAGPNRIARAVPAEPTADGRLLAGYMARPLFPENFSATDVADQWSQRRIADWVTFYQGATRLVDYLNNVGYNGLMLGVLADGSTIYPSELVESTPQYDSGAFAATAQDPLRKDVLEMLFRLFDRESLRLIPSLHFDAPLPRLEQLLREGGSDAVGIEPVRGDGTTWSQRYAANQGLAPYYNPLNPRVQEAMLAVVGELVARYRQHSSLGGIAIELSGHGYAQLPGAQWCLDDQTVASFERETGIDVPGEGADRFSARERFLLAQPNRDAWLNWRAEKMASFYQRVAQVVTSARPGAKLYLATSETFDAPSLQSRLWPNFARRVDLDEVLLEMGLDEKRLTRDGDVVFLPPQYVAPSTPLDDQAVRMVINDAVQQRGQVSDENSAAPGAMLLYHPPQRHKLPSFDAKSPFGRENTYTSLVAQPLPGDAANRRRFVQSLAHNDARQVFDGGWLLPLGQQDSLRPLIEVFRRLPADATVVQTIVRQPVTIRTLKSDDQTTVYMVNDSPWTVRVKATIEAPPNVVVTDLGSQTPNRSLAASGENRVWTVNLEPYGLVAARFADSSVRVRQAQVDIPEAALQALNLRLDQWTMRIGNLATLSTTPGPANLDFEESSFGMGMGTEISGWYIAEEVPGVTAELDTVNPKSGERSLRLSSTGPVATVLSDPFPSPTTGRMWVTVSLRTTNGTKHPTVRMSVERADEGEPYTRSASIGPATPAPQRLETTWKPYIFPVDDLATAGPQQIRLRFDLVGEGTVWIDEVQLTDFAHNERVDLVSLNFNARAGLKTEAYSDCLRILEGYWPRFLEEHVPLPEGTLPTSAPAPSPAVRAPQPAPEKPGVAERIRGYLPGFLRF